VERTSAAYVQAFQAALLPELSHIRGVFTWAVRCQAWDVLLRFAPVAHMQVLRYFMANSFEVRLESTMTTLVEPLIWHQGDRPKLLIQAYGMSTEWAVHGLAQRDPVIQHQRAGDFLLFSQDTPLTEDDRCELNLKLTAGQIVDGVFDTMSLVDAQWAG